MDSLAALRDALLQVVAAGRGGTAAQVLSTSRGQRCVLDGPRSLLCRVPLRMVFWRGLYGCGGRHVLLGWRLKQSRHYVCGLAARTGRRRTLALLRCCRCELPAPLM